MNARNTAGGFLALVLLAPAAMAKEYTCTISDVLALNDAGAFATHGWAANYLQRRFFVDSDTGRVTGTTALKVRLSNFNADNAPELLRPDGGLLAVTVMPGSQSAAMLRIDAEGGNGARPFFYHTAIGMVLTGLCTDRPGPE